MDRNVVMWQGELLWPQELPDGDVIDLSKVVAVGAWVFDWFRQHPNRSVYGAHDTLMRQLRRSGAPVMLCDSREVALRSSGGVSPSEKEMLWN